jgi:hypothetical protein
MRMLGIPIRGGPGGSEGNFKPGGKGKGKGKPGAKGKGKGNAGQKAPGANAAPSGDKLGLDQAKLGALGEMAAINAQEMSAQIETRRGDAEANKLEADLYGSRLTNFRTTMDTITKVPRQIMSGLFENKYPLSQYIALFVVVLVLFGGITAYLVKSKKKPVSTKKPNAFTRFIQKLMPGYRSRMFAKSLSSTSVVTLPRDKVVGRCDNIYWKQTGNAAKGGLCSRTTIPDKLVWIMDVENQPEYPSIPSIQKDLITNNQKKFTVYIPWKITKSDSMNYYPDCSKATFSDGTDASYLLTDMGTYCKKKEVKRTAYKDGYRPSNILGNTNYKGLDVFATENNPMCN